jgi:predicted nuclease with TOPRIM domain
MGLRKFKIIVPVAMSIAGLSASLVVQHRAEARIRGNEEVLARQANRLAELAAEHERLSNRVAELQSSPAAGQVGELERLRIEADRLREQSKELQSNMRQSNGSR